MINMAEQKKYNHLSILLVEDDGPSRFYIQTILKSICGKILTAENGLKGLNLYKEHLPDIVISDIGMPIMNGLEMSEKIKEINPKAQIVLTTAFDNRESFIRAIDVGISQYILKPINKSSINRAIERIDNVLQLEKEITRQYNYIQKLSGAVEHSPSMVIIINNEKIIEYINPKFIEVTGYSEEDMVGKDIAELICNASNEDEKEAEKKIVAFYDKISRKDTDVWRNDFILKKKNSENFWTSVSVSGVEDSDGFISHSVILMEDITESVLAKKELQKAHDELEVRVIERTLELQDSNRKLEAEIEVRKRTEHDLRIAKEVAEQANKAKSSFLAKVSHELRTPMNGILGITSLLLGTQIDEKQKKFLDMVKQSADNLLKIINDILDYSKIESGKLSINPTQMNISHVVEETLNLHKHSIELKKLDLMVSIDENIPGVVIGDPGRIQQVLVNLVSNAMKFTEKGTIEVQCKLLKLTEMKATIRFTVKDTGIGIPKDKISLLFKSFSQIDGSFTRKYGGTGLGLSISKELVEMMNGRINVESEEGRGSNFFFDIPFPIEVKTEQVTEKQEEENVVEIAARYPDFPARILVAEDSIINQEVIKKVLGLKSWDVMVASTGKEALELYESMDFDIIFMDVQMPEMDGLEATKKIREINRDDKKIPIIGLTAHGYEMHKRECLSAGMDDYITKPIDWTVIFSTICKFMGIELKEVNEDINIKKMISTIGGNLNVFNRIADHFINNYEKELQELKNAIESSDFHTLERKAHKLKSELGNFHSPNSVDIARNLEIMGRNKKIDEAMNQYNLLSKQMELIKDKIIEAKNDLQ
jgi:PAS domain S-box-containing protein